MSTFLGKLKRFFIRLSVYQIIFLWTLIRLNDMQKSTGEFKDKLSRNLNYFQIKNPTINEMIEDPSLVLLGLLICEIIFGLMGLFGSFKGNFMSAWLFFFSTFIHFNPFLPENSISLYETRIELLYNIGIFLTLLLIAYYPYEDKNKGRVYTIDDIDEEEGERVEDQVEEDEVKNVKKPKGKKKSKNK